MEGIMTLLSRIPFVKAKETQKENLSRDEILLELRETSKQIAAARCRFDHETNFDLIDSDIMEMDSLEKRYSYLIKRAKREKIAAF